MEPIRTDPVDHARIILVSYIAGALCSSAARASQNVYLPFGKDRRDVAIGCAREVAGDEPAPLRDLTLATVCIVLAVVFLVISIGNR